MILSENGMEIQYEIMSDEQKNEVGSYIPSYDVLIAESPNTEMQNKWVECRELLEKIGRENAKHSGFAFNAVYMMQMSCGHYEIFQHSVRSEEELIDWVKMMKEENRKCSSCICSFK